MGKDFFVTVTGDRAAEWEQIFGTTTVNVRSPIPQWADLPGKGKSLIFLLDLELITPTQRQRLVEHISRKWNQPPAEVEAEIKARGVPILDEDCIVGVLNPQRWLDIGEGLELEEDDWPEADDYDPYFDDYGEDEL